MVIGLLSIVAIPTITGVGQAVSAQKRQNASSKEQEKFNLTAKIKGDNGARDEEAVCFLKDGKLFLQSPDQNVDGHKFCGFHFKYPGEEQHLGLVSSIKDDPPMLNWIYINAETNALEHGARKDATGHTVGPWGWSPDERFLTIGGSPDGFVASREAADGVDSVERWAICWDGDALPQGDEKDEKDGSRKQGQCHVQTIRLCRKPILGMDSSYVKDGDA
ncbi:hypothetical protein EsDP_00006335 [Epichloe bromicola]|uniref:Cell wall protein PhiA n=1 Tax=Epichloe bromicola TaxID=79588 RepID=A0ABQ0CXB7_9HYPO